MDIVGTIEHSCGKGPHYRSRVSVAELDTERNLTMHTKKSKQKSNFARVLSQLATKQSNRRIALHMLYS